MGSRSGRSLLVPNRSILPVGYSFAGRGLMYQNPDEPR